MSKRELNKLRDLIEQLFVDSVAGKLGNQSITIGILTKQGKEALMSISGLKFKDEVKFCLHTSDLVHIYNRHYGRNESDRRRQIPLTIEDIRSIADILMHPDVITYIGENANGHNFRLALECTDGRLSMIEVCALGKSRLTPKSYLKKKKGATSTGSASDSILSLTSETAGATLSGANIPILLESK
mgnify:CR=1 FL=1